MTSEDVARFYRLLDMFVGWLRNTKIFMPRVPRAVPTGMGQTILIILHVLSLTATAVFIWCFASRVLVQNALSITARELKYRFGLNFNMLGPLLLKPLNCLPDRR